MDLEIRLNMRKKLFELQQRKNIFLLHADMFPYKGDKIVNCHVCESTMVNIAAGMSRVGTPVFIYGVCGFVFLNALEQIKFNLINYGAQYAPILWFNAGYVGCYDNFGEGHIFKEELDLCSLYNIPVYTPNINNFNEICEELLCSNGLKYIRLGWDELK